MQPPLTPPPPAATWDLWLTLSFCLQVYGARSLPNPASTGASVKLFSTGRRCASKYGGAQRIFISPDQSIDMHVDFALKALDLIGQDAFSFLEWQE